MTSPDPVVGALVVYFGTLPCLQTSDSALIRESQKDRNTKGEFPCLYVLAHCLRDTEQRLKVAEAQATYEMSWPTPSRTLQLQDRRRL